MREAIGRRARGWSLSQVLPPQADQEESKPRPRSDAKTLPQAPSIEADAMNFQPCSAVLISALHCCAEPCAALYRSAMQSRAKTPVGAELNPTISAMHCTVQHCFALHCVALRCSSELCSASRSYAVPCVALRCKDARESGQSRTSRCYALHSGALPRAVVQCLAMPCDASPSNALRSRASHCTAKRSLDARRSVVTGRIRSSLHCDALHCAAVSSYANHS